MTMPVVVRPTPNRPESNSWLYCDFEYDYCYSDYESDEEAEIEKIETVEIAEIETSKAKRSLPARYLALSST